MKRVRYTSILSLSIQLLSFYMLSLFILSCGNGSGQEEGKNEEESAVKVALCEHGNGCQQIPIGVGITVIAKEFGYTDWSSGDSSIAVIEKCTLRQERELNLQQLHESYGGTGEPGFQRDFDLKKHLKTYGCAPCSNPTKKISFYVSADDDSGTGYFYLNMRAGEAFMPDEAYKMMHKDLGGMVVNSFFRDYQYISYIIDPEGNRYQMSMPIGTDVVNLKNDAWNEKYFKDNFRKTGQTKPFLGTDRNALEYTGNCDMGLCTFWLVPSDDVCLPDGKFDALAFYNLGYLNIDGVTYIVSEISGSGFLIRMTGYENGSYQFNTSGYTPVGTLIPDGMQIPIP